MNYTVDWEERAVNELAAVWSAAADRAAVTRAVEVLEDSLARNPLRTGKARASSVQRIAYLDQIWIEFEVIEDDKRVIVQAAFAVG